MHTPRKFKIGIILLILNFALAGLAVIILAIGAGTRNGIYFYLSAGCYALSWIVFGLGLFLAGPHSLRFTKALIHKWFVSLRQRILPHHKTKATRNEQD